MDESSKVKVYYNSACPVCKAGIEGQMEKGSTCDVQWNDVHKDNQLVSEVGAQLEFVRERLHVVDEHGDLQVGLDAFLAIWRNSPKEGWKANLLGLPVIKQAARLGYNLFARVLYDWNRSQKHW